MNGEKGSETNPSKGGWQRKELVRPELQRISDVEWEIKPSFKQGMRVPARLFATKALLKDMDLTVFDQLTNVACLPGIVKAAYCMPDAHSGYGFPIGGVAAFDPEAGVISPGGIGFDINCGMRLVTTNLPLKEVQPRIREVVDLLFKRVPSGVGGSGFLKLNNDQFDEIMQTGAKWCVEQGYGWKEDLDAIEEQGCIKGADPAAVSNRARGRGINQVGTLGSGNHYLEVQTPSQVHEKEIADEWDIRQDGVVVMVHCGSRGFGHQVGTDYLLRFDNVMREQGIKILDRELSCAPFSCTEGQNYFKAMACAANMAFANRQVILHRIRECFEAVFKQSAEDLGMHLVYDVCHNIAKLEKHEVDGKMKELLVHRKGATRCFGPARMGSKFPMGQPVIIGGSMETGSYVLVGNDASTATFASTAHGSGRTMSRTKAKGMIRGDALQKDMEQRGIYVRTASYAGLAEEAGFAYKDISEVVKTMTEAGVSRPVVALRPIGNVKG